MRGVINKFNRGEISAEAFTRDDYEKVSNSCALMRNFMPKRLGPMMFRPGTKMLGEVDENTLPIPFYSGDGDSALIAMSDGVMRVLVNDQFITRQTATTAITNGDFAANITGWTDNSDTGCTTAWDASGAAALTGTESGRAVLYQTVTTDINQSQAIRFVISKAPVTVRIGTGGADSYDIFDGELLPGTHSLAILPQADITITLICYSRYEALVDDISVEAAGVFEIDTPYSGADLPYLRYDQSGDVIYLACAGNPAYQIERRGESSWSLVQFRSDDGPFGIINTSSISMTPSNYFGDITLTASAAYFTEDHVGSLIKIISYNQRASAVGSALNVTTDEILVTGLDRELSYSLSGTWSGEVVLEQSSDGSAWTAKESRTGNGSWTYDDELPNASLYYRLRFSIRTSGSVTMAIAYSGGSNEGIVRITGYTSSTVVDAQVLKTISSLDDTRDWYPGAWSDAGSYPSAVSFYEQRLWLAGDGNLWGSVSDAWPSYDSSIEGGSRAIQKTAGFSTSKHVAWLASSDKLVIGLPTDEVTVKSNSFSEPLTQDNCNIKRGSNIGAADISPVIIDDEIVFVSRSGNRLFTLSLNQRDTYSATDLNMLNREICEEGIRSIAVSRHPETRVYIVMTDGTARVYLYDPVESVSAWMRLETDGLYTGVAVIPGEDEDQVYFVVNRTNGNYIEKQAYFSEVETWHADCSVQLPIPGTTLSGLPQYNGHTVSVWADGTHIGNYAVTTGQIILPASYSLVNLGIYYEADYYSNKLNKFVDGSVLSVSKRVKDFSLILRDSVLGMISVGPDESNLKPFPAVMNGRAGDLTHVVDDYDEASFAFNGNTGHDPRIWIKATGPCTILAMTYGVDPEPRSAP